MTLALLPKNSQSRKITVDIVFELGQLLIAGKQDTGKEFKSEEVCGKKLDEYLIVANGMFQAFPIYETLN